MAAANPEVLISPLVNMLATQFQRLNLSFWGPAVQRLHLQQFRYENRILIWSANLFCAKHFLQLADIYLLLHVKSLLLYGGELPPIAGERGKNTVAGLRVNHSLGSRFIRGTLLQVPQAPTTTMHSADFAVHFRSKVDVYVRQLSMHRHSILLADSAPVYHSSEEIVKIISLAPAKHCQLDPAPTSLVKRLLPLLVTTFATHHSSLPDILNKTSFDHDWRNWRSSPEDLNSFRPISKLSFVSKIVKRVVVSRFNEHRVTPLTTKSTICL